MENKEKPDVFLAIADPTRRRILALLTAGALSINTLAANFDISRPAVSKHIKLLSDAGLVSITDAGRERYCTLHTGGFEEIRNWLNFFETFWKEKMLNLETLLSTLEKAESAGKTKEKIKN